MFVKFSNCFMFLCLLFVVVFFADGRVTNTVFCSNSLLVSASMPDKVILGGCPVGFDYYGDGVLVLSNNSENVKLGDQKLEIGDVIKKIDDVEVFCGNDISNYLNTRDNLTENVVVTAIRGEKELKISVKPTFDCFTNSFKICVWVKDNVSGLGTLTYINPQNGYYGALGHPLNEGTTGKLLPVKTGVLYDCNILGIAKNAKGLPGELKGSISKNKRIGTVDKNTQFGVFGKITNEKMLTSDNLIEVGGKRTVKPGNAKIYTSIDNDGVKAYDIQIIKTNYQTKSNAKSLVLKVVDKELLAKTGGIVQGMSGSPIVQDGKLIGALTHVFLNDSSKGFGVYIDWML